MSYRLELQKLALDVNGLLSEYISLHDTLQKKSNSFLSIFKPINFDELHHKAENILIKLKNKLSEISELKTDIKDNNERQFASCLSEYTHALITTLGLYKKMVVDLAHKSGGGKLSLKEHMTNSNNYKESISQYAIIGQKLNDLYKNL